MTSTNDLILKKIEDPSCKNPPIWHGMTRVLLFVFISIRHIGGNGIRIPLSINDPQGYRNQMFYGTISIGTPPQKLNISFDTTVYYNILLTNYCEGSYCHDENHTTYNHTTFNYKNSTTYRCRRWFCHRGTDTFSIGNIQIQKVEFAHVRPSMLPEFDIKLSGAVSLHPHNEEFLEHCKKLGLEKKFSFYTNYPWDYSTSELMLCGEDKTKFRGNLQYVPMTNANITWGWSITTQSIFLHHNDKSVRTMEFLDRVFMVEPDFPYIRVPSKDIEKIHEVLHITTSKNGNLEEVDCKTVHTLPSITFRIAGTDFTLDGNDYIQQLMQNDQQVCIVRLIPQVGPFHSDYWTIGNVFTRKFYTVIDVEKRRVGFAESIHGNRPEVFLYKHDSE
ncbi:lysosomal aspartic protease-like [Planococcus citri]|uniref:lysosomal aspartic protease-like n=1 Tax=Planococcus citri TaxID=170843 RepID=UPI0031F8608D